MKRTDIRSQRSVGGRRAPCAASPDAERPDHLPAFSLLELLVVIGLIAALSFFLIGGLRGNGRAGALQSAQAMLVNLVTVARTKAMATGQSSRVMVQVDVASAIQPARYLRYVAVQNLTASGWVTIIDVFLPDGVYVIPGNFSSIPAGLFAGDTASPWTKSDGSALRSTALRANAISSEAINSPELEQWAGITISANAGTVQSGDLILAAGKMRPLGSYSPGESPVELENPENVRGLTLSAYAVPVLINERGSF